MQLRSGQQLSPAAWDCVWAKCVFVCVPLHVRCCYMWAYSCECCCSRRMRFTSACGKSSCFHSLSFTLRSRREAFRVVWVRWCCMQVNKSHRASSLDLSKQEKENAFLKVKGWGVGGRKKREGCVWLVWGEEGGWRQESAASAKGPPACAGLATPSAGPRSIQTQSNKAFPLSSPQNTKQTGEGKGGEQGMGCWGGRGAVPLATPIS